MRQGLVAIIAVAIIGTIGIYTRSSDKSAASGLTNSGSSQAATAVKAADTSSTTPASSTNASDNSTISSSSSSQSSGYKDGTYKGVAEDTAYGTVQISLVISGGQITGVNFLQMPSDEGHSREVTAMAEPGLRQTTLQKQSASIDFVSGATSTSEGYKLSLQSALNQA